MMFNPQHTQLTREHFTLYIMPNTTHLGTSVKRVADVLNIARQHNLEAEVMATAMINLKIGCCITIDEALQDALIEWDLI